MNDFDKYVQRLEWELREFPEELKADLMAEVQTHIEDGLEDEETAVTHKKLLQELGSPTELARNLHWASWKRNALDAALALVPLQLLSLLNNLNLGHFEMAAEPIFLIYTLNFLICVSMVLLAHKRRSKLLVGWWLAILLSTTFSAYNDSINSPHLWLPGVFWQTMPLALTIVAGGIYGRFLWHNRFDGLVITAALTPFFWGQTVMINIMTLNIFNSWSQLLWANTLWLTAFIIIALTAFLYPNRLHRWLLLFVWFTLTAIGNVVIWWPNALAIFWLPMALPFLLGLGIELASNRAYKVKSLAASS